MQGKKQTKKPEVSLQKMGAKKANGETIRQKLKEKQDLNLTIMCTYYAQEAIIASPLNKKQ